MDELLTTTLSPALSHIIERPRLIERIQEADARVVLFAAPAGYGKTTLAKQWSTRQAGPVVWHRTTRASGDVAALAVRIDDALDAAVPQPGRDPRRVAAIASVNPHPSPLSRAVLSTYAGLTDDVLLIVDEWEAADTAEADEFLGTLVEELKIRFLITSRTRPPWFTSRLKVYGEALEIGMDELAMTDEEASAVLAALPDSTPLKATARGWPAILGLAAMQATSLTSSSSAAAQALYDFLAAELLDAAPPNVEQATALLAASSAGDIETAHLLLGDNAVALLDEACKRGFVQPDDGSGIRLHPLLRDIVLSRLRRRVDEGEDGALESLRRLFKGEKWDESLSASENLLDSDYVSDALKAALPALLRSGRLTTLRRWADVGRTVRAEAALVDYTEGEIALRDSDFERAIVLGERSGPRLLGDLASRAHLLAARAANLTDRADRARIHFDAAERLAETAGTRADALWGKFTQAIDDETPDVRDALDAFVSASAGDSDQQIRAAQGRITLALVEGGVEIALDEGLVAAALIGPESDPMVCTSFFNNYAAALSAWGQYEQALRAAAREFELADACGFEFVRRYALVNKARALTGLRRVPAAGRTIADLERKLRVRGDDFLWANWAIERSRLFITIGDLERALGALFADEELRVGASTRGERLALRALVLAAASRSSDAASDAARAVALSHHVQVRGLATVATCIARLDEAASENTQAQALHEIRVSGSLDALVLGCRACPDLAAWFVAEDDCRDFVAGLLSRSRDSTLARRLGVATPRAARHSALLSPRELEIHGLIAQGLTNGEISRLLFISESTTKVHVRHILEKLGLRSRVEAARVWRGLEDESA